MLKQGISTAIVRGIIAIANFIIVVLTARYLGASGRGLISLFVVQLTMVVTVNNIVGGTSLVYLSSRMQQKGLLLASYVWCFIACIFLTAIISYFNFLDDEFTVHLFLLGLLQCIAGIHLQFLLGKEEISKYNLLSALQIILQVIALISIFEFFKTKNISIYFWSLYISLGISVLIGFYFIKSDLEKTFNGSILTTIKSCMRFGIISQTANIIQLLNYRLSYFVINEYHDEQMVGVFGVAVSVAESLWIITNSFAAMLYARVSNSKDEERNQILTLQLIRWMPVATLPFVILLILIPKSFYGILFGAGFEKVAVVIPWLAPGILFFVITLVVAHYFSGKGKPKISMYGSLIGLLMTIITAYATIPHGGLRGAAFTATVSYLITSIYMLNRFKTATNYSWWDFMISEKDFRGFIKLFSKN